MMIKLKRVYEKPSKDDGVRILVERLWPRGQTKEVAALDHWVKDIAPSPGLRKWYGHDPEKWDAFQTKYRKELDENADNVAILKTLFSKPQITFLFAAKDEERNSAVVLKEYIERL